MVCLFVCSEGGAEGGQFGEQTVGTLGYCGELRPPERTGLCCYTVSIMCRCVVWDCVWCLVCMSVDVMCVCVCSMECV